jgi:hypothetical protein
MRIDSALLCRTLFHYLRYLLVKIGVVGQRLVPARFMYIQAGNHKGVPLQEEK